MRHSLSWRFRFEFGYLNRDQLELIEKKAESINRMLWKLSKSLEKSEDR
ncbi:hypothetical protein PHOSAC3_120744 [Mesotoga infera]|nr:hypothetical protein PHOSAC3_120744 [Mesotoga infera]